MKFRSIIKNSPGGESVLALISVMSGMYDELHSRLDGLFCKLADSAACQFFIEHKRRIAMCLYMAWLICCGYWIYELVIIDVEPKKNLGLVLNDSRDALVILFFGILGLVFLFFVALFIIKLVYNLFHDGLESAFPSQWHSIVKPTAYMVLMYFAFSYTGTIKMAGLTAYNQVVEIVHTSKNQNLVIKKELPEDIEKKVNALFDFLEQADSEE